MKLVDIFVAKHGMAMTQATLERWLVRVGQAVEKGDGVAEIATDKVNMTVEAPASGIVAEHLVEQGLDFAVPGAIGRIEVS